MIPCHGNAFCIRKSIGGTSRALVYSLLLAWTGCWINSWVAGDTWPGPHCNMQTLLLLFCSLGSTLIRVWSNTFASMFDLCPSDGFRCLGWPLWDLQTWWRHQMETYSALLAICAGNSPVTGEFPAQRPETRSFDVFFDLGLIERLSKQSRGWWFETPSRPLWRHCNGDPSRDELSHWETTSQNNVFSHRLSPSPVWFLDLYKF